VTKPTPDYLRLADLTLDPLPLGAGDNALLGRTCEAFEQATGWKLQYEPSPEKVQNPNLVWSAPVDPGVGASLGLIRTGFVSSAPTDRAGVPLLDAVPLAETMAQLWAEIVALRQGIRSREAELAADVPVVARREDAHRTAARFEAILKAGAEAVRCQAAALYLLDAATTTLKLRTVWGLPERKLLDPPRELAGAMADLEALLGHAVVLSDPAMIRYWHAPEKSGASVCVPVSSPTTPLGTLWLFSDLPRDFSDSETNLVEVVAGRLAAELEREVLLDDARQNQTQRREIDVAAERQTESLPRIAPLLDRWQVAGRLIDGSQSLDGDAQLAGAFFDWFHTADGVTALTLGAAAESGFGGAVLAAQLRSALRAQADRLVEVDRAIFTAHEVLASLSAGSSGASAFCGLLPASPQRSASGRLSVVTPVEEVRFAAAGHVHALVVTAAGCRPLVHPTDRLVTSLSPGWSEIRTRLGPGESLLVYVAGSSDDRWQQAGAAARLLAERLVAALPSDAERLADAAAQAIADAAQAAGTRGDGALLVIRPV
jgi:GAF domain-containing protein